TGGAPTIGRHSARRRCAAGRGHTTALRGERGVAMQITVSSRGTEVSDALRAAAVQKVERVGSLLPGALRAEVHFCEERNPRIAEREVCEVTLVSGRQHLQCRAAAADSFAA